MTSRVTDPRSNSQDQLAYLAKAVGKSPQRIAVFRAIHTNKARFKSVAELVKATGLSRKRVLEEAKKLVNREVVNQGTKNNEIAYEKDSYCYSNLEKIIDYGKYPQKLKKLATKVNPQPIGGVQVSIKAPKALIRTAAITIDEVDQFAKVRKIKGQHRPITMSETKFKNGVKALLGEYGSFKDWGGETSDLFTSRLKVKGKRCPVAFAFKGPGTTGLLTPGKLGKNGDQIQRLFAEDADIYYVQYVGQIASTVLQQMAVFAQAKSLSTGRKIFYGVIDGSDSARLVAAYPTAFK
jgi:hypothetical protein